jgi:hypothetical protein
LWEGGWGITFEKKVESNNGRKKKVWNFWRRGIGRGAGGVVGGGWREIYFQSTGRSGMENPMEGQRDERLTAETGARGPWI